MLTILTDLLLSSEACNEGMGGDCDKHDYFFVIILMTIRTTTYL